MLSLQGAVNPSDIEAMIERMHDEWAGKGMIANMEGVRQVSINTSTMVPVQLFNNRNNVVTMAAAPKVEAMPRRTLTKLGVSTTGSWTGHQLRTDHTHRQDIFPPSSEPQVNPPLTTCEFATLPNLPQVGTSQGGTKSQENQDKMSIGGEVYGQATPIITSQLLEVP